MFQYPSVDKTVGHAGLMVKHKNQVALGDSVSIQATEQTVSPYSNFA